MAEKKEQLERRKKVLYDMICDKHYIPMKIKEIAILLSVPREQREELREVLDALIVEGKIELTAKGKYRRATAKFLEGTFIAHPRGFGFVEVDGRESDIFIPEDQTGGAMHRDTVQVAILQRTEGKRQEGTVVKITERGIKELIGTYQSRSTQNYGFVLPDNQRITRDIFIAQENSAGAMDGHKVLVELLSYGEKGKSPEGRIKEIIGHINDPGTDILSVVYEYSLPFEFPDRVMKQAERTSVCVSEADRQGRRDLRSMTMVTIDGEDAKDLDDAVSLSFDGTDYHLGVHIADVANYVQENSALDCEARQRGTSVYLADRVIPMLPHRLSNGICSLNAGVDRLAMSCLMKIDAKGNVIDHEITESVICVRHRLSYTQVKEILSGTKQPCTDEIGKQLREEYKDVVPMLEEMERLMQILRKKRKKRGAIDFNFSESKVVLDENGVPLEIRPQEPNTATRIIEEFMLCANETVAEHFFWQETPFLYRIHEAPDSEKIEQLAAFIASFGYGIKGISDEVHPKELQKLLARTADTPEELMISRLTLRSMKQARYATEDTGHFGLAAQHYCHFTSPIRRYPDLQIHRIIKDVLRGRLGQEKNGHYAQLLPDIAQHCSRTERRADEAERDTVKMKKAEYMAGHIGEEYDAVITGLMSYGMYAELPNTVEGLIHVTRMYDDRYYYREESYEMYGMDTGRIFRLGDTIRVRVTDADKAAKTVDFELV
ncbi:ribonuclease R [Parablautia sp. Marseille-Q6255]|uniref:ribonuclease R n=1 Tax=Parablautia sp. Marseille-Q6255 TaxID=3039593 RepID=UPI0024BD08A0|nr:ribonuclease R [Parablautia sp. Marseille-Q6255]